MFNVYKYYVIFTKNKQHFINTRNDCCSRANARAYHP